MKGYSYFYNLFAILGNILQSFMLHAHDTVVSQNKISREIAIARKLECSSREKFNPFLWVVAKFYSRTLRSQLD